MPHIKVVRIIEKTISRCYHECPYFQYDMGGMFCEHPSLPGDEASARIISHPDCDTGFPKKCPLLKES